MLVGYFDLRFQKNCRSMPFFLSPINRCKERQFSDVCQCAVVASSMQMHSELHNWRKMSSWFIFSLSTCLLKQNKWWSTGETGLTAPKSWKCIVFNKIAVLKRKERLHLKRFSVGGSKNRIASSSCLAINVNPCKEVRLGTTNLFPVLCDVFLTVNATVSKQCYFNS